MHDSCIDHLADDLGSLLVVLGILFDHLESSPQLSHLRQLLGLILLPQNGFLIILFDLCHSTATLGAHLEHVCALALSNYKINALNRLECDLSYGRQMLSS